jgi:hypothetical protein
MKNTIILALFFGAMGIVVLYNIIVLFVTKELNYLYFILFFITIGFHHLMYKDVMTLYFSPLFGYFLKLECLFCGISIFLSTSF